MLFSQGSSSGFAYDYTRQYTYTLSGGTIWSKPNINSAPTYILPEDSFVSSSSIFYINGGQCSRYWVNTKSSSGTGNHYTSHTESTYINFAFCKKGDKITSGYESDTYHGRWYTSYYEIGLTIIPVRK